MLKLKKICDVSKDNAAKAKSLYYRAFPKNERRPFPELTEYRIGDTETFCIFDDNLFVGMAVVMNSPSIAHIIYLAIEDSLRGHGYGSQALKLLHEFYSEKKTMVDIERCDGTSKNEEQRVLRKQFYLKSGYSETSVKYRWRNENYEILSFGGNITEQDYNEFWTDFFNNSTKSS